jgi:CRP-like cAMP-binding protein
MRSWSPGTATRIRAAVPTIGPVERALALRSLPLFRSLKAHEVALLAQQLRESALRPGRALHSAGERIEAVHLLTEGRLRQCRDGGPPSWIDAPHTIGLLELLAAEPARTTVIAETPVRALVIDRAALFDALEDQFSLVLQLRTALGGQIAERRAASGAYQLPRELSATLFGAVAPDQFDLVHSLLWLQQVAELRPLGVAVLAALLRNEGATPLRAGEQLFEAGSDPTRFVLLVAGTVRCTPPDAEPFRADPGDVLGRDAVLSGSPHPYSAIAETAGLAIGIDGRVFWDLAEDHFHVALAALSMSARRLLWLDERRAEADMPDGAPQSSATERL